MKISKIFVLSAAALSLAACGEHTHSFGEAWKSDDTSHWHECECGEKSDKADHLDTNIDGKCDVCNHDMEVPTPTGTEVTKEEWEAAFGLDKTFYFADNYKISMIMSRTDGEMSKEGTIDGNKLKKVSRSGGSELESYYSKEGNTYYQFTKSEDKWKKEPYSINPMNDFTVNLEPFENIESFTYDSESGTYKCASLSYKETPITNLFIKFNNKRVMNAGFDANMGGVDIHLETTIVYGGQTVTLPDIPQPSYTKMTEEQFDKLFSKIKNSGFAVEFELFSKNGDAVLPLQKISFKWDIVSTSFEELYYNDTGAIVDGSVLKDLKGYQYKSGAWNNGETLTEQEARETFNTQIERMFGTFFYSTTYADYNFDETSGKYKVDLTNEYQFHSVVIYTMNAEGITKIEGSITGESKGDSIVSTFTTSSVNVGPQTISKPTVDPGPAKAMTEDEFNALVDKAFTKGIYYKTSTPQADCISSTVIFDCVNKNLYIKEHYKDRDFPGITVYCNSVAYFSSPLTGEWQEPQTFSPEDLETQFDAALVEYLMQILPTTDFSDFTFNPDDETYEVTMNFSPYEGVEITMVYIYVMDANGITSISGTTTYVFGGETQTSTVSIYDIDIGEQEISAPF